MALRVNSKTFREIAWAFTAPSKDAVRPTGDAGEGWVKFTVPVKPVPQPRHRVGKFGAYIPKSHPVRAYKDAVRFVARQFITGLPFDGPLKVSLVFVFDRPQRMVWINKTMVRELCNSKAVGDVDNLQKSTLDSLEGIAFRNDGQVAELTCSKWYAAADEATHVEIEVRRLNQ